MNFAALLMPSQDLAFVIAIAWTAVNMLLNNVVVSREKMMLPVVRGISYISAFSYALNALAMLELSEQVSDCNIAPEVATRLPKFLPNAPMLASPTIQEGLREPIEGCEIRFSELLDYLDVQWTYGEHVGIMVAYLAAVHLITYLALLRLSRREKR